MVGLDVAVQTTITEEMWQAIRDDANSAAGLVRDIFGRTFADHVRCDVFLHDPLAAAVALDRTRVSGRRYAMSVSTDDDTRGRATVSEGGNILVDSEVRSEAFLLRLWDALGMGRTESG